MMNWFRAACGLIIIFIASIVMAQEFEPDEIEKAVYTSIDESIRFYYPSNWLVTESMDGRNITLLSRQSIKERASLYIGSELIFASGEIITGIMLSERSEDDEAAFSAVRQLEALLANPESRDTMLAGKRTLIISGSLDNDSLGTPQGDILVIIMLLDKQVVTVIAFSKLGELAAQETTIFEIVESLVVGEVVARFDRYFSSSFEEDDDTNRFWPQKDNVESLNGEIEDGYYRLTLDSPGSLLLQTAHYALTFDNVIINMQVEIQPETAETIRSYGIVFRRVDAQNYYLFEVYANNNYGIWVLDAGEWHQLIYTAFPENVVIDDDTYDLQVKLNHDMITVGINGEILTTISDERFASGGVGIYVASNSGNVEEAQLLIDSFSVALLTE